MYAGNGGPTKPDGYFLTPFMPKTMEMALPVPTRTAEPRHGYAVCTLRVHPPTSPCPALSALTEPISQGHCRKSHDEAESIMTTFGPEDRGGYLCQTVSSISLQPKLATVGFTGINGTDTSSKTQYIGC